MVVGALEQYSWRGVSEAVMGMGVAEMRMGNWDRSTRDKNLLDVDMMSILASAVKNR